MFRFSLNGTLHLNRGDSFLIETFIIVVLTLFCYGGTCCEILIKGNSSYVFFIVSIPSMGHVCLTIKEDNNTTVMLRVGSLTIKGWSLYV